MRSLIEASAKQQPDALAIASPDRLGLSFHSLRCFLDDTARRLHRLGIGRRDRIAVLGPNGPETTLAVLAAMYRACCVPLNPASPEQEMVASLTRLKATCLMMPRDLALPAAVEALRLKLIRFTPCLDSAAGLFDLGVPDDSPSVELDVATPDDTALVMQTSGTSGVPKCVPLFHRNICSSARDVRRCLLLSPADRFLNVARIFHIAGIGLTLASLSAGSAVFCAPGFYGPRFFQWMDEFRPTWFWVAPAMLRELVAMAAGNSGLIQACRLRFIRCGSAPLPPELLLEAEQAFGVPVLQNYGMTEASPQITCIPLPPRKRKPGSSGLPAGPEVRILREEGDSALPGGIGEIVVRGDNVTSGYENSSENAAVFRDGWFRTGDLGFLDAEGYLFVVGRVGDLINRGGEKIAPREVEEALLRHPAVSEAVVFPIPHSELAQDVAAAVVLRSGASAGQSELRAFVASQLAEYKVPATLLFVARIPTGPGNKVQRARLAEQLLPLAAQPPRPQAKPFVAPQTAFQEAIAAIWTKILGVGRIGIHDDFYERGGDSFAVALLFTTIAEELGAEMDRLNRMRFFDEPSVARLAEIVESERGKGQTTSVRFPGGPATASDGGAPRKDLYHRCLLPIQANGAKRPFFCVPRAAEGGDYFRSLAVQLGSEQPLYVLEQPEPPEQRGVYSIEEMASRFVEAVRTVQPCGPYLLGGHCFGAAVAFEMAQQLTAAGEEVGLLAIFNAAAPGYPSLLRHRRLYWARMLYQMRALSHTPFRNLWHHFVLRGIGLLLQIGREARAAADRGLLSRGLGTTVLRAQTSALRANQRAFRMYKPCPYSGAIVHFNALRVWQRGYVLDARMGWQEVACGGVQPISVEAEEDAILREPHVRRLARHLKIVLDQAQARSGEAIRGCT